MAVEFDGDGGVVDEELDLGVGVDFAVEHLLTVFFLQFGKNEEWFAVNEAAVVGNFRFEGLAFKWRIARAVGHVLDDVAQLVGGQFLAECLAIERAVRPVAAGAVVFEIGDQAQAGEFRRCGWCRGQASEEERSQAADQR